MLLDHQIFIQWQVLLTRNVNLLEAETIRVHVLVARDGRISQATVTPNKPNDPLAQIALRAIHQVKPHPIPGNVADGKPLPLDLIFDVK